MTGSGSDSSKPPPHDVNSNEKLRPPEQPQQPQQHEQHVPNESLSSSLGFLPEPFPTAARANAKRHFHDAFGDSDSGLDYGPRNEFEDDCESSNNSGTGSIGRYGEDDDGEYCADVERSLAGEATAAVVYDGQLTNLEKEEKRKVDDEAAGGEIVGNHGKEVTRGHSNDAFIAAKNIDLQQLEEEVGLHEATLGSLTLKLRTLKSHIQSEEHNFNSLKKEVASLEERQGAFRRRTDTNLRLVKDLEASLEKCLERLRRALDAVVDVGQVGLNTGVGGDQNAAKVVRFFLPSSGEGEANGSQGEVDTIEQERSTIPRATNNALITQQIPSDVNLQEDKGERAAKASPYLDQLPTQQTTPTTNNHSLLPLTSTYFPSGWGLSFLVQASHSRKSKKCERRFVRKMEHSVRELRTDFFDHGTHHGLTPLLHRINSEALICRIMNVAVLEHLLEMEELQKSGVTAATSCGGDGDGGEQSQRLPKTCGWVDEVRSVSGTLLDVSAQFDLKDLSSGFRGAGEVYGRKTGFPMAKEMQAMVKPPLLRLTQEEDAATTSMNDADSIDPNVVLCPYELGGTCADDQCPYQHLRQDSSNIKKECSQAATSKMKRIVLSSQSGGNEDGSYEKGYYVRYNNLPKPHLPRALSGYEFITQRPKEERNDRKNDAAALEDDQYHCPTRVDLSRTYYSEVVGVHLKECCSSSRSSLANNQNDNGGRSVIHHVLQHAPDDGYDFDSVSIQQGIDEDDNSAVMRDYSSEKELKLEHDEFVCVENMLEDDDADRPAEGSYDSGKNENECVRMAPEEGSHNSNATVDNHHFATSDVVDQYLAGIENVDKHGTSTHSLPCEEPEEEVAVCEAQNNPDYVSLPFVADSVDDSDSHADDSNTGGNTDDKPKAILSGMFWWQQQEFYHLFLASAQASENTEDSHTDTFERLLRAFGFQKCCSRGKRADGEAMQRHYSLQYTRLSPSKHSSVSSLQEDVLLFSRIVDLSRMCIHMGRDSFALSALDGVCQSRAKDDPITALLEGASKSIKSLCHARCSTVFQVQVYLLLVSESLRVHHDCLCNADGVTVVDHSIIETLVDQIAHLANQDKFVAKKMLPAGFDAVSQRLVSGLPPVTSRTTANNGNDDNEWAAFVKTLKFMMEKFILTPFSQLGTTANLHDQLSFLMQCVCIGKFLERLLGNSASKEQTFASYLHGLEPIWSSLQPLLQMAPGQEFKGWLQPDLVAIVTMGPVFVACVADTIAAPPCNIDSVSSAPLLKLPSKLDPRAHATVSFLDGFIVGILKELSCLGRLRGSHGRFSEALLTPLYALSATICIILGSFEKAHQRLSNLLAGSGSGKCPSMYALSEMVWSQLVQIRMICPSYSIPLKKITDQISDDELVMAALPKEVLGTHHEIASRIAESGIFLWGVKLPGDSHMSIMLPCRNRVRCQEWEKVARLTSTEHPWKEVDGNEDEAEQRPSEVELCISDLYSGLVGVKGRAAVFPESVLLLGKTLTNLSLEKCGLKRLPFSLGYHLTKLQSLNLSNNLLLELPSSIGLMIRLEVLNISYNCLKTFPKVNNCRNLRVIDVSHNQLMSFPADLALECHNLQSFLVGGNPAASDILLPP